MTTMEDVSRDVDRMVVGSAPTDVTGCRDCPLREDYEGLGQHCHVMSAVLYALPDEEQDDREIDTDAYNGEAPDWCPLRKGPITIRLVTK